ncbi:MAG TPA: bifunctional riboflavin kinase/FAD synthetase [Terriglobia bacterium]|nr:bifunctional riboflavin kinase/FAD synthetase [Terriglobia bacterium]
MKVVSSLSAASDVLASASVLSIGNFDGLHLGHQAILQTVVRRARELGLPAVAITFEPHPIQVLAPDKAPKRITTPARKIQLIAESGIDLLFTIRFDHEFALCTPEDFIRRYLVEGLRARAICVGANFGFGHRQSGTVDTLRQWAHEFELLEVPQVLWRTLPVSSTQVRKDVLEGNVTRVSRLLARWFELEGRIVSGAGRGRTVTVPTLNLNPENELLPRDGVYVTRIAVNDGAYMDAVTNIGVRPTFGETQRTIETFVLQRSVPQEAMRAQLQFLHRIRDERRFDSPVQLSEQIGRDIQRTSKFFRLLGTIGHARIQSPYSR